MKFFKVEFYNPRIGLQPERTFIDKDGDGKVDEYVLVKADGKKLTYSGSKAEAAWKKVAENVSLDKFIEKHLKRAKPVFADGHIKFPRQGVPCGGKTRKNSTLICVERRTKDVKRSICLKMGGKDIENPSTLVLGEDIKTYGKKHVKRSRHGLQHYFMPKLRVTIGLGDELHDDGASSENGLIGDMLGLWQSLLLRQCYGDEGDGGPL